jgi:hypothetical protein
MLISIIISINRITNGALVKCFIEVSAFLS